MMTRGKGGDDAEDRKEQKRHKNQHTIFMTDIWFFRAISGCLMREVIMVADWVGLGWRWFGMLISLLC